MRKKIVQALALVLAAFPVVALAQAPKDGVYISDEDVKAVLKYAVDTKRTIVDNTIRVIDMNCLLYTSPSPRDRQKSRMPSSA